jgi:DNA-binding GntR family transcriptional regulator
MERFRLELGPIPLHHQVYLDLRTMLDRGVWAAGDRLPPERDLATRYGCSLITVRRALAELALEGRIERTRGRGTHVLRQRIDHDFAGALSFDEQMQQHGLEATTKIVESRLQPAGEAVAQALDITPGRQTIFLERLRLAGGEPLILEQAHLSADRFPDLWTEDLEHQSLYRLLAERYGTRIVRIAEAIEPIVLRTREARLLGRGRRTPALLVEGIAYGTDARPVEFARSFVAGDRTRYFVERRVARSTQSTADRERMPSASRQFREAASR